mgnify:FL=1
MDKVIGWIGVGSMGSRMAVNLSKSGYSIIVADKISTEAAPKNAEVATNNQELAQKAEVVIFSVPAGPDTLTIAQEFIKTPDRIVKTVIDTSTIGIPHAREAFELFKAHGIEYIDAPVSGGIAGAEAGTLAVMVGCQLDSFDKFKPILKCIGQNIIHVGSKAGQGQTVKLLNNFLSATAMAATSEAMAFGTAKGLVMKCILSVVNVSRCRNTASMMIFPNRVVTEAYNGGFATKMMAKDVKLYVENVSTIGSAERLGPLVADTFAQLEKFETNSDFTKIYPFIRDKHFSD